MSGLGLPGHFLAMYKPSNNQITKTKDDSLSDGSESEIIIDAFGGEIIDRNKAADISGFALEDLSFEPYPKKDIIKRMLRNLLQSAEKEEDSVSQIRYLDTLLAISPEDRYSRAKRAMLTYILGNFDRSLSDIDFLLEDDPESPENEPLRVIRNRLIDQGSSAF